MNKIKLITIYKLYSLTQINPLICLLCLLSTTENKFKDTWNAYLLCFLSTEAVLALSIATLHMPHVSFSQEKTLASFELSQSYSSFSSLLICLLNGSTQPLILALECHTAFSVCSVTDKPRYPALTPKPQPSTTCRYSIPAKSQCSFPWHSLGRVVKI